ncbi:MAG: CGNR zinc finger domain-containing protein [Thermoleophilia bacterium]|nr:CGNR zinc finger domain-containing protein [Thermoleophilia bacterium]
MTVSSGATAPGRLELVRAFVNTLDVESGEDVLAPPGAVAAWLAAHDLLAPGAAAGAAATRRALDVREALRALLVANNGGVRDAAAAVVLEAAAGRARLALRFRPDGSAGLEPAAGGVDGALGRLLAAVADAMAAGTWERLKACRAEGCRWAFYDRARNRSRAWCSMAVCGNRAKARAYRARAAG